MSAAFRCYLEAFYRGYNRYSRSHKGKDHVHYQYVGTYNDCRVTTWRYDGRVFAAIMWISNGARYLWLSKPPKPKKAVTSRLAAVLFRYCDHIKGPPPEWTRDGKLFIYLPGAERNYNELSIEQRIKQIYGSLR